MAPRTWTNGGGTPLSAANLNALEAELAAKAEGNHTHASATGSLNGFMSSTDKTKLDELQTGSSIVPTDLSLTSTGGWAVDSANAPVGANVSYTSTVTRQVGTASSADWIDFDPNRTYFYSYDIYSNGAGQVTYFELGWRDKAGAGLGSASRLLANYIIPTAAWTHFEGLIGPGMPIVPPAGTARINPLIYVNHANGTQGNVLSLSNFKIIDVSGAINVIRGSSFLATSALNGSMSATDKAKLDNAVSAATASRLAIRDASGRLAVAAPAAVGDAATKNYVDTGLAGKAAIQSAADLTYYVSTTGSNSNTGLTVGAPFLTVQKAVDVAAATSLGNDKTAIINVAAGTYAGRVIIPAFTENRLNITIQGPEVAHPGVPTVVQTEGATVSAVAYLCLNPNATLKVRNVKFVGYRNSTASGGITLANGGYLLTENCHFTDCYWGISGQKAQIDVKGGIFDGCGKLGTSGTGSGAGIRSLQLNQHAIGAQGAGNLNSGPIFKNSIAGVFAQELSTGHVDWCTIEDCTFGLNLAVNARVNSDGTSFKRNAVDIRATSGANIYLTANNAFGTDVDESNVKLLLSNGATVNDDYRVFTNILQSNGGWYRSADTVFPNTSVTAQVTTTVYTATLGAGLWRQDTSALGLGRKLNVKIYGTLNGTLGVKDVTVRMGSSIVSNQFTAAEAGGFEAEATIFFTGKATQLLSMRGYKHLGGSMRVSTASGTNAMTADTNLTVEARAGTAGDSVLISAIELNWS